MKNSNGNGHLRILLRTKILFGVILMISITLFFIGGVIIKRERGCQINQLTQRAETQIKSAVANIIRPMELSNSAWLKDDINHLVNWGEEILYLKLTDQNGKLIEEKRKDIQVEDKNIYKVYAPVLHNGKTIGNIEMGFSKISMETSIKQMISTMTILFITSVLALFIVIWINIKKVILDPVANLIDASNNISKGYLSKRAVKISDDELGDLSIAFNRMADTYEKTHHLLQTANLRIMDLLTSVEKKKDFKVRFDNPNLRQCWEIKKCGNKKCPSYGSNDLRCWQLAGTHCDGMIQGEFAKKIGHCENCEVYKMATPDKINETGEIFNNMMFILEQKEKELEKAKEKVEGYNKTLELKVAEKMEELEKIHVQIFQIEKLKAIGQLAAGLAHEINNPLGVILGFAQSVARRIKEDDPFFMPLKSIEREAQRCKTLVQDLLTFSRANKAEQEECDINNVIESALSLIEAQTKMKMITLEKNFEMNLTRVMLDSNQIQQVIINLCNNAMDAMPKGGNLTITTKMAGLPRPDAASGLAMTGRSDVIASETKQSLMEISVSDTGVGIPDELKNKIFEPFFTTKEVGEGTGLGLSLCYEIIQMHNGAIEVQSEIGKGTTFTVRLPKA